MAGAGRNTAERTFFDAAQQPTITDTIGLKTIRGKRRACFASHPAAGPKRAAQDRSSASSRQFFYNFMTTVDNLTFQNAKVIALGQRQ